LRCGADGPSCADGSWGTVAARAFGLFAALGASEQHGPQRAFGGLCMGLPMRDRTAGDYKRGPLPLSRAWPSRVQAASRPIGACSRGLDRSTVGVRLRAPCVRITVGMEFGRGSPGNTHILHLGDCSVSDYCFLHHSSAALCGFRRLCFCWLRGRCGCSIIVVRDAQQLGSCLGMAGRDNVSRRSLDWNLCHYSGDASSYGQRYSLPSCAGGYVDAGPSSCGRS
jgi:hypothetical protein